MNRKRPSIPFFLALLFSAIFAYGQQQERVAIINTVDDGDSIKPSDLAYLTGKLRETAVNVLPKQRYGVMTTESIVAFLGSQERAAKECREASCLAELGRKVSADYVAQARIGRFGGNLTINTELYNSKSGNLIGSFMGNSKDIFGLLTIIDEKAPDLFKKLPSVLSGSNAAPPAAAEKASGLEKIITHYELDDNKSFTDARDGKKYKTVVIGKQTWMAENLNYNVNGSKCYDNKPANCNKYGKLYDWETAMKACPRGWHLPSKAEWTTLTNFAGGITAGTKLKATSGWYNDGNGTDDFGFTALPGGRFYNNVTFEKIGDEGYWWSATETNADDAFYQYMVGSGIKKSKLNYGKDNFRSVRCVKDD